MDTPAAPTADDLILISVDDHICEPADMFVRHVPARWADQAPRSSRSPAGRSSGTTATCADAIWG